MTINNIEELDIDLKKINNNSVILKHHWICLLSKANLIILLKK
jgi:hypothetical protein